MYFKPFNMFSRVGLKMFYVFLFTFLLKKHRKHFTLPKKAEEAFLWLCGIEIFGEKTDKHILLKIQQVSLFPMDFNFSFIFLFENCSQFYLTGCICLKSFLFYSILLFLKRKHFIGGWWNDESGTFRKNALFKI